MFWGMLEFSISPLVSTLTENDDGKLRRLGTGAAGPAFFGLGVKQSLVILLVVDLM